MRTSQEIQDRMFADAEFVRKFNEDVIKSKEEKIRHLERCLRKRRKRAAKTGQFVREKRGIVIPEEKPDDSKRSR